MLPVAFGSLALGATYLLGRRLFDLTTAIVAIAVLAVHGFTTRYATEVRGYSLMVLLTLLAALVLHRAVTERATAVVDLVRRAGGARLLRPRTGRC